MKEQFVPEENRDIASFNADNEFNRAIDEENIDFNIPGVPRQALQSDIQQHRQFNPFSKESQDVIKAAGNTELCELLDVEPKAQCKACLSYCDVGIVYCTCGHFLRDDTTENKKYIKSVLDLFSIPNFCIRKGRPHSHRYGKNERSDSRDGQVGERGPHRSNWWIRSNFVGSDTMPIRHRADFKEALSTLRRLKNEEDRA